MAQRGRKSAASLSVIATVADAPLAPPGGLSVAERNLWRETVAGLPASYFPPESGEQLAGYCRHAVTARALSQQIAEFRLACLTAEGGVVRIDRLLRMRERETRAMLACARALRLTNQSRQDPKTSGRRSGGPAPSVYDLMLGTDDGE